MEPETSKLETVEVDVEALKRKYAEERAKRLRPDAIDQYQHMSGSLEAFGADPRANPDFTRDPIAEDTDVLMIGGGFAGMLSGARLREAGIENIRIVEKGADFGGTWYWNRYPGAACDVESYIYMPLLEELGVIPTEKYAKAPEIYAHCQRIARHYDLYRAALFQTAVEKVRWDEDRKRWIVTTDRGDQIAARFVISGTGLLSTPKLPGIPGIQSFEGASFHTSRWDYGYTGGDELSPMVGLADKRVGIIGTGSTGIQVTPELAKSAKHLFVFQRTPSSVDTRGNRPTDPDFAGLLAPGWQRERRDNFTTLTSGGQAPVDMVNDSWTDIIANIGAVVGGAKTLDPAAMELAQMRKMELNRRRVDSIVEDQETADALKPWYNYFCKRPCFHDDYLQAFNRPNVTLVDTKGKGVDKITPTGVVVAGQEYPLDLLVYATGFDYMVGYSNETGIEVIGPGGRTLTEHWQDGASTLYGMQTHGFPNFFLMTLLHAGVSVNYVHIADEQTKHIAHIISHCLASGIATVQPSQEAEDAWLGEIMDGAEARRIAAETCTPSVFNHEGRRSRAMERNVPYTKGPLAYIGILESWRADGTMPGLELVPGDGG